MWRSQAIPRIGKFSVAFVLNATRPAYSIRKVPQILNFRDTRRSVRAACGAKAHREHSSVQRERSLQWAFLPTA
jgi:hypothetical protein